MRYLLITLAAIPTACGFHPTLLLSNPGRGIINPPTIYEMKEHKCLATMIYGEARGETKSGQTAVAYTALNRAVKKTVCDVILAPKQYSIFNNNPALRAAALSAYVDPKQNNIIDAAAWKKSISVAEEVIYKKIPDPTYGSTHYLAPKVMHSKKYKYPKWSYQYNLMVVIDNHRFYKFSTKV